MLAISLALALQAGTAPAPLQPLRIPSAPRNAGVYHVATGTWTRRGGATAAFGPDVVYDNTAPSGYFTSAAAPGSPFSGEAVTDHGGVPGPSNGEHSHPGIVDAYAIDGFEIGYCGVGPSTTAGYRIKFYDEFHACSSPAVSPVSTIDIVGLPASGCWTVTVDLQGSPQAFCLTADGGISSPVWNDDPDLDSFSWSYEHLGGALSGFMLAGDPTNTESTYFPVNPWDRARDGTGTFFGPSSLCATPGATLGTGYLTTDTFFLPGYGCVFFGGYRNVNGCGGPQRDPYASFHMKLFAHAGVVCDLTSFSTQYCASNPNSTGSVGDLRLLGSDVASHDDVTMIAEFLPAGSFGVFITSQSQGFVSNPAGSQGNLCMGGNIGRFVAPGQIKLSDANGHITLSTALGEWSLTSIPTSTGPYAAASGLTTNFQLWHRDSSGGAAVSNFTNGHTVVWQ